MTNHHTLFKHPIKQKDDVDSVATWGMIPVIKWPRNLTITQYHGSKTQETPRNYCMWSININLSFPKVSQDFKSTDFNQGPDHDMISKYWVQPLG